MQTIFRILAATVALAASVSGRPAGQLGTRASQNDLLFNCDVSDVKPWLPADQQNVTVPMDQKPRFITVGVGVQNYTCSDAGKFTSVGAVASLYDVSCIAKLPIAQHIQDYMFTALNANDAPSVVDLLLLEGTLKIGDHYFIAGKDGKLVPVFDFTNTLKDKEQFVNVAKKGNIASPDSPGDVDWLELKRWRARQPRPPSASTRTLASPRHQWCMSGDKISVPYAAQYWFYD
ncbi:hypothetical protein BKA62DRAFT_696357 [Auriculariales sp. MPI-PUGE-AT-0066]|nr:hypothetical protein BKA62DRAFT_696357 [Auriculariales sp. MPI-PUGE-AT-0066]